MRRSHERATNLTAVFDEDCRARSRLSRSPRSHRRLHDVHTLHVCEYYRWSLFVVKAGGVGVRCYSLCVSFHYVRGIRTFFGPYFLVPIGLALALIWLEIGIAARRRGVMVDAACGRFHGDDWLSLRAGISALPRPVPRDPGEVTRFLGAPRCGDFPCVCSRAQGAAGVGVAGSGASSSFTLLTSASTSSCMRACSVTS
jgi:hypothetical protein